MSRIMPVTENAIAEAVEILRQGGLVAAPTETVYGLAANSCNGDAVADIFATKGRPQINPLISHVSSIEMAKRYVTFDPLSLSLAKQFWPGPLTLVLPLKSLERDNIHSLATAGLPTLAIRMPQGVLGRLSALLDRPLSAPSANISGRISPTSAQAVADDLGDKVAMILDGGQCEVGLESTIIKVDAGEVYLLRPGGLSAEEIEKFLGRKLHRMDQRAAIQAPGMLASHYAPNATMRLNIDEVQEGETLLAFGATRVKNAEKSVKTLNLSPTGDLLEAAKNLFNYMKKLDAVGAKTIAVEPIPERGLGEAILDRLRRAAAPR